VDEAYGTALLDWLACASAGREERAAAAALAAGDGVLERIAYAGTAGHVLDFDDTFLPGLAHLSAPTAPVALVLGADLGASIGETLDAYAAGFEAMGALAEASHPELYDGGWHATAVCGVVGAAVTAARLLRLDLERERTAARLALLGASGLRAAFGSDGKSLQVGLAATTGAHAAQLAAGGARVGDTATGPAGFEEAFGGAWSGPSPAGPSAIARNWIKPYPCCLKAHSAIEAAAAASDPGGPLTVVVHPRARAAARYDDVETGLEAKFSIPYLTAYTLLHGPPTAPAAFASVDADARALAAERVRVRTDATLGEAEAVLLADGDGELARVPASSGSPDNPLPAERLRAKVSELARGKLDDALADPARPAAELLRQAGLEPSAG
jgi:2-methylcitrate dehydratase PrpD